MIEHESLTLPLTELPPLSPRRNMAPYVMCWCQSGKKWKWCHKDREKQPQDDINKQLSEMRARYQYGYCSHPDASPTTCSDQIIRAHTVQRSGGLSAIAERGHVISTLSAAHDLFKNHGEWIPREVGVNSASTFPGFCGYHDSAMFRPAELGPVTINHETAFLLSFRSLAYELFLKRVQFRALPVQRLSDRGAPFERQVAIQNYLNYHEMGMRFALADLEKLKNYYDQAYRERRYNVFHYFGVSFPSVLPLVCCGSFYPEFDFSGRILQRLGRGANSCEQVTLNLTVIEGRTTAILSWSANAGGPAQRFAQSFADLPDTDMANSIVRLAFEHSENVYLKPSWWNGLSDDLRQAAIRRMGSGSAFQAEREASCLLPDRIIYVGPTQIAEKVLND